MVSSFLQLPLSKKPQGAAGHGVAPGAEGGSGEVRKRMVMGVPRDAQAQAGRTRELEERGQGLSAAPGVLEASSEARRDALVSRDQGVVTAARGTRWNLNVIVQIRP